MYAPLMWLCQFLQQALLNVPCRSNRFYHPVLSTLSAIRETWKLHPLDNNHAIRIKKRCAPKSAPDIKASYTGIKSLLNCITSPGTAPSGIQCTFDNSRVVYLTIAVNQQLQVRIALNRCMVSGLKQTIYMHCGRY